MSERPPVVTYALIAINVIMFGLCVYSSGDSGFTNRLLISYGAIVNTTLDDHDYWRLVAAAFLHGNFVHILTNMYCLFAWAPLLERFLGPVEFLGVYLLSAIGGSTASILMHSQPYLSVGASGALSGLIGALLSLTLLGSLRLSSQFFISTLVLNGVIMSTNPRIDWQCHLGGFITGMAVCAALVAARGQYRRA